jgi:hypothetical protein
MNFKKGDTIKMVVKNGKILLLTVCFAPMFGYGQITTFPPANVHDISYNPERERKECKMAHAKILSELYSDYKKECWSDSTLDTGVRMRQCDHEYCRSIISKHIARCDSLYKNRKNNEWVNCGSTYECYKAFVHRNPTFEGFMEYISKLK